MTDPKILAGIRMANEASQREQREVEVARGVARAMVELPAAELLKLGGRIALIGYDKADQDGAELTFTMHAVGNPRAYEISLPVSIVEQFYELTRPAAAETATGGVVTDPMPIDDGPADLVITPQRNAL